MLGTLRATLDRRSVALVRQVVPASVRRRVWRLLGRSVAKRPGPASGPALSVIIPVYNVRAYLSECLESVLKQSLTNLEVIVVDDGSTDGSETVIAAYAARDTRVRTYRQENAGQGAARNVGVRHARGRFLTFLDADDIVPPAAYRYMIDALRRSGSDFAVGAARRVQNGRYSQPSWNSIVHDRDRIGITIDDFPAALADVIACNRMFRRGFWIKQVGAFPEGVVYEDHLPMVVAYIRASRFDLLARVTYDWRLREDQTSTGQQKHELRNLTDRIRVKADTHEVVRSEASSQVYAAWLGRVLDTDFAAYIQPALRANDEYRNALRETLAHHRRLASPEAFEYVRVQQKVRTFLASAGAWSVIEDADQFFRDNTPVPPTDIRVGRVVLATSPVASSDTELPESTLRLSQAQIGVRACASDARWVSPRTMVLTGWAYLTHIDLEHREPRLEAWLERTDGSERIDVEVQPLELPEATRWAGWRHGRMDRAGFRASLHFGDGDDAGQGVWRLRLRVTVDGISREGGLHHALAGSPAMRTRIQALQVSDALIVTPRYDAEHGLMLVARSPVIVADELGELTLDREVVVRFRSLDASFVPIDVLAKGRPDGMRAAARVRRLGDEQYELRVQLPRRRAGEEGFAPAEWDLFVVDGNGRQEAVVWPATLDVGALASDSIEAMADTIRWDRSAQGTVRVFADAPYLRATAIDADSTTIVIQVECQSITDRMLGTMRLTTINDPVPPLALERLSRRELRLTFRNAMSEFGLEERPLKPGSYNLIVTDGRGVDQYVTLAAPFAVNLPLDINTDVHRLRVTASPSGALRINLRAPLRDDELSNRDQQVLRTGHKEGNYTEEDAVLFQCYRGEVATDSQLAIHQELRRRGSPLRLFWGISDHSAWLPEGAIGLVIGSREWYEKLSSVRYLCNNVDFDGFFRKRPHQRYLQTFHGYPFKSMGKSFWWAKGYTPGRIQRETARRNDEWDSILVPAPFCTPYYRREYDYTGQSLALGYPRTDALVSEAAPQTRAAVRSRLQLPDDATVVLYAPTLRDALTTKVFAAKRFNALDLDVLSAALGDRYVILVRGHNNNQRDTDRVRGRAAVIDVTDYPEINDLTLAADVAVLDYSSLRFDWALTGKPMLFFVPDLQEYFAFRPPLFDYESSAPGPLLANTQEVADSLRDLEAVPHRYAAEIAEFNRRFNELHDGRAAERVVDAFFLPATPNVRHVVR